MPKMRDRGVVSFPKCGRTWIRLFLEYYGRFTGFGKLTKVSYTHKTNKFDFKRRLLLIRHPCDVMVSYHLQQQIRDNVPVPGLSEFIRSERWGVPFFSRCYVEWSRNRGSQLVLCFEDLFDAQPWVDMLKFFSIPYQKAAFDKSRRRTRFDAIRRNMKEISRFPEALRYLPAEHGKWNVIHPDNPDAHKFRRGKVGGYVDYLSEEDIRYILDTFTLGDPLEPYRQRYL